MHPQNAISSRRAAQVLALGEIFANFGGEEVARRTISAGGDMIDFHKEIGARIRAGASLDHAAGLDFDPDYLRRFSLSRLLKSQMGVPDSQAIEGHAASEIMSRAGARYDGTPIPWSVLTRDFNMGTLSEAGNLVGVERPAGYLRDPLRAALALGKLGATIAGGFKMDFSVPRFSTDTSVGALTEIQASSETQPGTSLSTAFNAKRVGGYVEVSSQTLIQGGPLIEQWITRCLRGIVLAQIENAGINADGTGANPMGIRSTPGIGSVVGGTNGAQLTWAHLVDLENVPALANATESELGGYLTNTKVRRWTKVTPRATNLPFIWENTATPLNGKPVAITSNVPSNLNKGTSNGVCSSVIYSSDWSTMLVAIFGNPDVVVDRVTKASTGQVRIIINVWLASGLLQPANFAVMDDALTV